MSPRHQPDVRTCVRRDRDPFRLGWVGLHDGCGTRPEADHRGSGDRSVGPHRPGGIDRQSVTPADAGHAQAPTETMTVRAAPPSTRKCHLRPPKDAERRIAPAHPAFSRSGVGRGKGRATCGEKPPAAKQPWGNYHLTQDRVSHHVRVSAWSPLPGGAKRERGAGNAQCLDCPRNCKRSVDADDATDRVTGWEGRRQHMSRESGDLPADQRDQPGGVSW